MSEVAAARPNAADESEEMRREPTADATCLHGLTVPITRRLTPQTTACDISIMTLIVLCELTWLAALALGLAHFAAS